jgi:hypothetical protein
VSEPASTTWNPHEPPAEPWEPPFAAMLSQTLTNRALRPPPPLRIVVTGSRDFGEPAVIDAQLEKAWKRAVDKNRKLEVAHGACPTGADAFTDMWVVAEGLVPVRFFADWEGPCNADCYPSHRRRRPHGSTFCPAAGYYRNREMIYASNYDLCLAFLARGAKNSGTRHAMRLARERGIPVEEHWGDRAMPPMAPRVYLPIPTHREHLDRNVISP